MAELEPLDSFEDFLFSAPPYKTYSIPDDDKGMLSEFSNHETDY